MFDIVLTAQQNGFDKVDADLPVQSNSRAGHAEEESEAKHADSESTLRNFLSVFGVGKDGKESRIDDGEAYVALSPLFNPENEGKVRSDGGTGIELAAPTATEDWRW